MWHKSNSNMRPDEVQLVAGNRYLLHRNIVEKTVEKNGEERTAFEYEEKLVTADEYKLMQELADRDSQIAEMQDALAELASIIAEG